MSRGGTHKEKVNLNGGEGWEGRDPDLLLRGRCPGNGATVPPHTRITVKEHKKNQCFFFPFLNNDLCLSTIVVIIRKCNSSLVLNSLEPCN